MTWAFGHLVGLAMPESYGLSGFRREHLPILPQEFRLVSRQVREGKAYKDDPGVVRQLGVIRELFDRCESIIVATDAGREGELIFRYVYNYLGCTKPFARLWISSLTDKAIREGLQNLKEGSLYDNLYLSAKARSEADWLVGINSSQALSLAAGQGVFSLGRVQTPHIGDDLLTLLGEQAVRAPDIFPDKGFGGQRMASTSLHCHRTASMTLIRSLPGFVRLRTAVCLPSLP